MDKDTQEQIQQLQMHEQNMQQLLMQRQQFGAQAIEFESALKELETTKTAYKIIGNIMVLSDKDELRKELSERKELLDLRLRSLEKQEEQLRNKAGLLKEQIMKHLKGGTHDE
ncbi:prefoldin subunit beta [Candidatus Woesearchaeota archaeon]|nr:prefoldin subunit beta [Candidatus Woesearchaeota archaeon]